MARIVNRSRNLMIGAAFLGVMAGTGGLIGAVCGVMLVLLARAVLGMADTLAVFIPASTGIGMLASVLLGILLMVRQAAPVSLTVASGPPAEVKKAA